MAQAKKGLGRGLSALIPTDMDFLAEVARGDFSILASTAELAPSQEKLEVGTSPEAADAHSTTDADRVARSVSRETSAGKPPASAGGSAGEVQVLAGWPLEAPATQVGSYGRKERGSSASGSGSESRGDVLWVSPERVVANPYQPRRSFDEAELQSLAESIREHGVLQPIIVRPLAMGPDFALDAEPAQGKLQLIAGERRWRAAQAAGLERVPVIVREVSDQQALELAIIENVQRHDISALDEAVAYKRLAREFGLSQEKIARRVGKSRPSVANTLRLLDLPPEAQEAIQERAISEGHGRAILLAPGEGARRAVLRAVLRGKLSVRQAEELAGRIARQARRDAQNPQDAQDADEQAAPGTGATSATGGQHGPAPQEELEEDAIPEHEDAVLEERLQRALSCRVQVRRRRAGGQIVLFASDGEQLDRIAAALAANSWRKAGS